MITTTDQWSSCRSQGTALAFGHKVAWNADCLGLLEFIALRIEDGSQYGAFLAQRVRDGFTSDFQTFACRSIRGASSHSEHSHSVAFDIRPPFNSLSDSGFLRTDFDHFGMGDGEAFLHSVMDPIDGLGAPFQWGGAEYTNDVSKAVDFLHQRGTQVTNGRVDAMHFEVDNTVTPEKIKALDWENLKEGIVPLTDEQQAALDFITQNRDQLEFAAGLAQGLNQHFDGKPEPTDQTPVRKGWRIFDALRPKP